MVEPEVVHVLIFDARDGRDLGEDVLAHQGVHDTEIFINLTAVRHELDGAGERGIRVDDVAELIVGEGLRIPVADTRPEIEVLLVHLISSKTKTGQLQGRCYPYRPATRTALPEREGPPTNRSENQIALDTHPAAALAGQFLTGRGLRGLRLRAGLGRDIYGLRDRERFAPLEPRRVDAKLRARTGRQAVEPDVLGELAGLLAVEGPEIRSDSGAGP